MVILHEVLHKVSFKLKQANSPEFFPLPPSVTGPLTTGACPYPYGSLLLPLLGFYHRGKQWTQMVEYTYRGSYHLLNDNTMAPILLMFLSSGYSLASYGLRGCWITFTMYILCMDPGRIASSNMKFLFLETNMPSFALKSIILSWSIKWLLTQRRLEEKQIQSCISGYPQHPTPPSCLGLSLGF